MKKSRAGLLMRRGTWLWLLALAACTAEPMDPSINEGRTAETSASKCAHPFCAPGLPLPKSCDPCVAKVCAKHPFCCLILWDEQCVKDVPSLCGESCTPDMATPPDMASPDLSTGQPDLSQRPDLSTGQPDLSSGQPDLATHPDLTTGQPDLTSHPDLTSPPDLTTPPDLTIHPDLTPAGDMKNPTCDGKTCQLGQVCCATAGTGGPVYTCQASCGDGGLPVSCAGPEDCGSGAPYCCSHISFGPGSLPNCPVLATSVACQPACNGDLPLSCPSMATLRLCNVGADCAGDPNGYTNCCDLSSGGVSSRLCITNLIKLVIKPTCF